MQRELILRLTELVAIEAMQMLGMKGKELDPDILIQSAYLVGRVDEKSVAMPNISTTHRNLKKIAGKIVRIAAGNEFNQLGSKIIVPGFKFQTERATNEQTT